MTFEGDAYCAMGETCNCSQARKAATGQGAVWRASALCLLAIGAAMLFAASKLTMEQSGAAQCRFRFTISDDAGAAPARTGSVGGCTPEQIPLPKERGGRPDEAGRQKRASGPALG